VEQNWSTAPNVANYGLRRRLLRNREDLTIDKFTVDQAGSPQRLRFPQPRQSTPAVTLREHPSSLATTQARLTSKTR
jgi:hypothetical protein